MSVQKILIRFKGKGALRIQIKISQYRTICPVQASLQRRFVGDFYTLLSETIPMFEPNATEMFQIYPQNATKMCK